MKDNQWILMWANEYEIIDPEFFDTYYDAHKEMKRQYEIVSKGGIGELNDTDAWCRVDGHDYMWKICHIE